MFKNQNNIFQGVRIPGSLPGSVCQEVTYENVEFVTNKPSVHIQ